jgi:hypothetical protein
VFLFLIFKTTQNFLGIGLRSIELLKTFSENIMVQKGTKSLSQFFEKIPFLKKKKVFWQVNLLELKPFSGKYVLY